MRRLAHIALAATTFVVGVGDMRAQNPDQLYFEFQVTKPARQAPGSSAPHYPVELRAAGVQGTTLVQFIVDTLGTPMMSSFKVLRSDHGLFTEAVRTAVPEMRFSPAEVNGHKVRQLVQQPFVFAIAGKEADMPKAPEPSFSAIPRVPLPLSPAPRAGMVDGWTFSQTIVVDSGGGSTPSRLSMNIVGTAGRLRLEISRPVTDALSGLVTLVDSASNRRSVVMPSRKMVTVSALSDRGTATIRSEPFVLSRMITDLGEGATVAGLPTRHYRIEGTSGARVTFGDQTCVIEQPTMSEVWMTSDSLFADVQRHQRGIGAILQAMSQIALVSSASPTEMPPGAPVKVVRKVSLVHKDGTTLVISFTTEVTSFTKGPIAAALFDAPEGFQVLEATAGQRVDARVDSLMRAAGERVFARLRDSSSTALGEKKSCTTSGKP